MFLHYVMTAATGMACELTHDVEKFVIQLVQELKNYVGKKNIF